MEQADKVIETVLPGGKKIYLRGDGNFYSFTDTFGAKIFAPLREQELALLLNGKSELEESDRKLTQTPDLQYKVPQPYIIAWAQQLLQFKAEALVVYGRHKKDKTKWMAIVPKQEVTSASVEVDDFGDASALLSKKGYQKVGSLHTHPGGMTTCSSIDTDELWKDFGGIHIIVTHTGIASWFFSSKEETWKLDKVKGWNHLKLWRKKPNNLKSIPSLKTENNDDDLDGVIKPPIIVVSKGFRNQSRNDRDYENTLFKPYIGVFNRHKQKWVYIKQADGQTVDWSYVQNFPAYWNTFRKTYVAGEEPDWHKANSYPIVTHKDNGKKEKRVNRKKSKKETEKLNNFCDLLKTLDDSKVADLEFLALYENTVDALADVASTLEALSVERIKQGNVAPAERFVIKQTFRQLLRIEKIIWGTDPHEALKRLAGHIPKTWMKGDSIWLHTEV